MTNDDARCRRCGQERPTDAPAGLCPSCLLRAGLDGAGSVPHEVTVTLGPAVPGALTELADSLGGLPRVLLRDTDPETGPGPVIRPASAEMPAVDDRAARLQLFGEIARGGMGAVLKGRDSDLGRDVAVKVLLEAHRDKPDLVRRFVEEAQIGGQLQHPGIVPIYELGAFADRRPYFAMKLVKGRTLSSLLAGRPDPAHDRPRFLSTFEAVCQTMAYAHARGVIHRNLKPSNVMVGSFGEVQVMDWGLAKVMQRGGAADDIAAGKTQESETVIATARSDSDSDLSRTGSVLGTPSYMAPEQARGETDRLDERCDVFALGSILCEILTGEPAFTGRSSGEIQRKAGRGGVKDATDRLDASGVDPELIALAKDCLAPEPEDRPRHAGEVAARINAYQTGVQERLRLAEIARAEEKARAAEERKRRKLTVALAASIIGTILVGGGAWYAKERQRQERAKMVDLALREAEVLRGAAEQVGDDPGRWVAAREAAHAVKRLLADARDEPTRWRVAQFVQEVTTAATAAANDQKLLSSLIDIRSAKGDDPDGSATDAAYADAFREAGVDVATLPPAEAGAKIKARPATVAVPLAAALDDWAAVRRGRRRNQAGAERLAQAARNADPEPWRNQLRDALDSPDQQKRLNTLRALAGSAKIDELPPVSLNLLGATLFVAGDPKMAQSVLRQAQRRYPGDVWLNYNLALCLERLGRREEAIRYYTAARSIRPETAHELAHALQAEGEPDEAIAVFQDVSRLRSGNGRHLGCLGRALKARGRSQEADTALAAAIAALHESIRQKPEDAVAHHSLGYVLTAQGKHSEAGAAYREAVRLKPDGARYHNNLAAALKATGDLDGALAAYREAVRCDPTNAGHHNGVGNVLEDKGDLEGALTSYREAVRLDPKAVWIHANLARTLQAQGKHSEAIAAYREAVRLRPDDAGAHGRLGNALGWQGRQEEASAECREVIRLRPEVPGAHYNLGLALSALGKRDEAITAFREAIRLKPDYAEAHSNLGTLLQAQGKHSEAIAECREVIRLQPGLPGAHYNLGLALSARGDHAGAAVAFREAQKLAPDHPGLPGEFRMVALAPRLPAVLRGDDRPAGAEQGVDFAQLCYRGQRFAAAARLYAAAFAERPALADGVHPGNRYDAARAAALAGVGQGRDEPPPDAAERGGLRRQALDWLRSHLAMHARQLEDPEQRGPVLGYLRLWREDPDLAGVRDPDALTDLSGAERRYWQSLWAEVDTLLAKARGIDP